MSSSTPPERPRGPFGSGPAARGPFGHPDPGGPDPAGGTPSGGRRDPGGLPFPRLNPLSRTADAPQRKRRSLSSRFVLLAVALFGFLLLWWIVEEFLPRWWAFQVGDTVDGSTARGVLLGLACGAAFTALPLYALRYPMRSGIRWSRRLLMAVGVLALALPNLLTLGIELGSDAAALYGRRIFDISAPGFRGASLFGALTALVATLVQRLAVAGRSSQDDEDGSGHAAT